MHSTSQSVVCRQSCWQHAVADRSMLACISYLVGKMGCFLVHYTAAAADESLFFDLPRHPVFVLGKQSPSSVSTVPAKTRSTTTAAGRIARTLFGFGKKKSSPF